MPMIFMQRYKLSSKKTPVKVRPGSKDLVKVFCRIRPLHNNEESCVKVTSQTTLSLLPPETRGSHRLANCKEIHHTFKYVFDAKATQKEVFDHVALPLVENLIHGKNGLLFTYGVTGSGKTFTMAGEPHNGGIMPRCLDVIFNSISSYQAKKFIFKPDKMNDFDIQSETDAVLDCQNEIHCARSLKTLRKVICFRKESDVDLSQRIPDGTKIESVVEDNSYAVFVTYVEIYNNAVYDLLENVPEDIIRSRQFQSKIVREDASHNMYVHSVTEIEVKSTEEAFDAFNKGQKRKRMAITTLNSESSRSHSVFTIRLVQAPLDSQGEHVFQDRKAMCISQLSLVDLAGSERTNRTKNSGQRLREAGNINNSLMTLRTCLEILRENQLYGANKMVPYRDSKMTLLFKNYFDGEGQVEMIVCLNPSIEDYDETVQVMKFTETTQEVQISQPAIRKLDFGLAPGRRKASHIFKQALQKMEDNGHKETSDIDVDIGIVYSLLPALPCLELTDPSMDTLIKDLAMFLELRMNRKNILLKDWHQKHQDFYKRLTEVEKEKLLAEQKCSSLKTAVEQGRNKISALEARLVGYESYVMNLEQQVEEKEVTLVTLKQELENQEILLQELLEKERLRKEYSDRTEVDKDKNSFFTLKNLKEQESVLKTQMRYQEQKLRKVKQILTEDSCLSTHAPRQSTKSLAIICKPPVLKTNISSHVFSSQSCKRGPAVSNRRHRRSQSAGDGTWLEHRPVPAIELSTLMQPLMKRYKSVTKLTDVKDIANSKTSKYCLMTQEQDSSGELETHLYKADVVPTVGGGAQVIFNDVETLKQQSPTTTPSRKRSASTSKLKDTEAECAMFMEGHKRARH
ncbi:kinesin-like protein KIF23 isoform X3 [Zootermopsis nevadensis]|uniref:kinesin-like protein KIF23 isoform X3 n=1 Tax=Zootermopsis nevadensis TaxID=136037 RepID=UPI000B8EB437|nr:kinesin-like protein KIF23 isoform X3 [Zootermopsis nevadensis]